MGACTLYIKRLKTNDEVMVLTIECSMYQYPLRHLIESLHIEVEIRREIPHSFFEEEITFLPLA